MGFTVIKGTFHVVGYSPDGDSIRFKANNESNWVKVEGNVKLNRKGHAQLRFQAIDTLETHYKKHHQPDEFAIGAMHLLLETLSIKDVKWNSSGSKISSAKDGTEGYVLCRESEKFGRPIVFVFAGSTNHEDGENVFVTPDMIQGSINYKMIEQGMAYPTFYFGLFYDLRQTFIDATVESRKNEVGLYAKDVTHSGFEVSGIESITDQHVILPKLFRRILAHLLNHDDLSNFIEELQKDRERVLILDKAHDTHFDSLLEVEGNKVTLTERIENLSFID